VEYDFTADLEETLDQISAGEADWKVFLRNFWSEFHAAVEDTGELRISEVLDALNESLGPLIFPKKEDGSDPRACASCAEDGRADGRLSLKTGKFGAFIGCSNYPECKFTRQLSALGEGEDGAESGDRLLGKDPKTGMDVWLKVGRFGPYFQLGEAEKESKEKPKRSSLPKGWSVADADLEKALMMLALPREVGPHPEDGEMIEAGLGRYGPFVKHGKTYANLANIDEVFEVGLNRAVTLIAEKIANPRGRKAATALKELGAHPETGDPVNVMDGRYGPYIKHQKTNATLPSGTDPQSMTLEQALELVAAKEKRPAKKKKAAKKKTAKKATAKKAAAKKVPAEKAAAKKAPSKKKAAKKTAK
jgi:DNA topoisomerase-1